MAKLISRSYAISLRVHTAELSRTDVPKVEKYKRREGVGETKEGRCPPLAACTIEAHRVNPTLKLRHSYFGSPSVAVRARQRERTHATRDVGGETSARTTNLRSRPKRKEGAARLHAALDVNAGLASSREAGTQQRRTRNRGARAGSPWASVWAQSTGCASSPMAARKAHTKDAWHALGSWPLFAAFPSDRRRRTAAHTAVREGTLC